MALDRRLQEDWARDAGEDPKVLMGIIEGPKTCKSLSEELSDYY